MAKKKKKSRPRLSAFAAAPSLAPQVLEQAAQGWLQSSGAARLVPQPAARPRDQQLAEVLTETLADVRAEISELRARIDRLEIR